MRLAFIVRFEFHIAEALQKCTIYILKALYFIQNGEYVKWKLSSYLEEENLIWKNPQNEIGLHSTEIQNRFIVTHSLAPVTWTQWNVHLANHDPPNAPTPVLQKPKSDKNLTLLISIIEKIIVSHCN